MRTRARTATIQARWRARRSRRRPSVLASARLLDQSLTRRRALASTWASGSVLSARRCSCRTPGPRPPLAVQALHPLLSLLRRAPAHCCSLSLHLHLHWQLQLLHSQTSRSTLSPSPQRLCRCRCRCRCSPSRQRTAGRRPSAPTSSYPQTASPRPHASGWPTTACACPSCGGCTTTTQSPSLCSLLPLPRGSRPGSATTALPSATAAKRRRSTRMKAAAVHVHLLLPAQQVAQRWHCRSVVAARISSLAQAQARRLLVLSQRVELL